MFHKGTGQNYYTRTGPTFGVGGFSKTPPIFELISWTLLTKFYWLLNLSWHRNIQLARVSITRQTRKVRFESHCNFLSLDRGVAMTLSKGVQADTTIYFVVWWVLFEYSSFDHFPKKLKQRMSQTKNLAFSYPKKSIYIFPLVKKWLVLPVVAYSYMFIFYFAFRLPCDIIFSRSKFLRKPYQNVMRPF